MLGKCGGVSGKCHGHMGHGQGNVGQYQREVWGSVRAVCTKLQITMTTKAHALRIQGAQKHAYPKMRYVLFSSANLPEGLQQMRHQKEALKFAGVHCC